MTATTHPPLSPRERRCMEALVCVHQEFGLFATITSEALTTLTDEPWTNSLAQLVEYGLARRENKTEDGNPVTGYGLTEQGWAEFAGVTGPAGAT